MNIQSQITADQLVPISKARATLPSLVEKVNEVDFFVLVNKYKPKAALVNILFLEKLLKVYKDWIRQKDLESMEKIWNSIPVYPEDEVEADIKYAIKQVRKNHKTRG